LALILTIAFSVLASPAAHAKETFYLDLKKGCYSGSNPTTSFLEWSGPNYKTLYRASCNSRYHYQVYALTKLSVNLGGDAAQKQAKDLCRSALARLVDRNNLRPRVGIAWFFPDPGMEERKYGKKLICFVRMASESDFYQSVVQTRPLI